MFVCAARTYGTHGRFSRRRASRLLPGKSCWDAKGAFRARIRGSEISTNPEAKSATVVRQSLTELRQPIPVHLDQLSA
jgi:hypothetical protein